MRYDPHLSLDLAEHASVVYRLPHQFARWALERGYAGSTVIERGATQVGVAYSESRIVVACRGSSERLDWIENMLAFRVPWLRIFPVGSVHVGFRRQALFDEPRERVEPGEAIELLRVSQPGGVERFSEKSNRLVVNLQRHGEGMSILPPMRK